MAWPMKSTCWGWVRKVKRGQVADDVEVAVTGGDAVVVVLAWTYLQHGSFRRVEMLSIDGPDRVSRHQPEELEVAEGAQPLATSPWMEGLPLAVAGDRRSGHGINFGQA